MEQSKNDNNDWYWVGAVITGLLVFAGVWIYAIAQWGFLLGIMFGWIPAIIAAFIAGLLWPLLALIILFVVGYILMNS